MNPINHYRYSCLVPFHLCDPAGVLFFGNVFSLVHQAFEHFIIHHLEYPWTYWFQNPDWFVPVRHTEAQYLHSLYAGQECQIEQSITSISTSSFTSSFDLHQNKLCCKVKTVHVFCNSSTKQKMPIPPFILDRIQSQDSKHS